MEPPGDILGAFLWNVGYSLCHQLPERSFIINGWQLPFCARDTGTFIGFLVVIVFFLIEGRYRRKKLPDKFIIALSIVGLAFYAFYGLSSYAGFRSTANELRLLSGLAYGSGMAFLITSASSILFFKADEQRQVFSYRDVLVIYLAMGILCLPFLFDMGAPSYYLISIAIVIGYLLMLFFLLGMAVAALTGWNMRGSGIVWKLAFVTAISESIIVVLLWFVHETFRFSIL